MTYDEILIRLKPTDERRQAAEATQIPIKYLNRLVYGEIKKPGVHRIDALRSHFISVDIQRGAPR